MAVVPPSPRSPPRRTVLPACHGLLYGTSLPKRRLVVLVPPVCALLLGRSRLVMYDMMSRDAVRHLSSLPQEVCRLYRASLKLLDSWAIDRTVFNDEATKIRASVCVRVCAFMCLYIASRCVRVSVFLCLCVAVVFGLVSLCLLCLLFPLRLMGQLPFDYIFLRPVCCLCAPAFDSGRSEMRYMVILHAWYVIF